MVRDNRYSCLTVAEVRQNRLLPSISTADTKLTAAFTDHLGQKFVGKEDPPEAPFGRVNYAAYKPITEGRVRSYTLLLRNEEKMIAGAVGKFPYEQTSSHDDARMSVVEKRSILYPEPLDLARLHRVYRIPTSRRFPSSIRGPPPRHPPIPRGSGSRGTLPFYNTPQPVSPPAARDQFMP